jgi:hypothetical protein
MLPLAPGYRRSRFPTEGRDGSVLSRAAIVSASGLLGQFTVAF